MSLVDRWRARTDDARRTKGDPPLTYTQLLDEIRQTQSALSRVTEMATNLRGQVDQLAKENARLRTALAEKTEYVETLALELAEADERRLSLDEDVTRPYIPKPEAS